MVHTVLTTVQTFLGHTNVTALKDSSYPVTTSNVLVSMSIQNHTCIPIFIFLFRVDVNECALDKGGCDHKCINKGGSFHCVCEDGYRLLSDGKTCVVGMYMYA